MSVNTPTVSTCDVPCSSDNYFSNTHCLRPVQTVAMQTRVRPPDLQWKWIFRQIFWLPFFHLPLSSNFIPLSAPSPSPFSVRPYLLGFHYIRGPFNQDGAILPVTLPAPHSGGSGAFCIGSEYRGSPESTLTIRWSISHKCHLHVWFSQDLLQERAT